MQNTFRGGARTRHENHPHHHDSNGRPHGRHGGDTQRHGRDAYRHGGFGRGARGADGFGAEGRMGRRGGRGHRTARGDIRMAILALISEQPRHGYEIIQAIDERSGGRWRPSPGSIYPTVAQLEDESLVDTEKVEGRRMVTLTEAGTAYVAEHRAEIDAVWDKTGDSSDEPTDALRAELQQLVAAVRQIAGVGSPEQIAATAEALSQARKATYRLLAE